MSLFFSLTGHGMRGSPWSHEDIAELSHGGAKLPLDFHFSTFASRLSSLDLCLNVVTRLCRLSVQVCACQPAYTFLFGHGILAQIQLDVSADNPDALDQSRHAQAWRALERERNKCRIGSRDGCNTEPPLPHHQRTRPSSLLKACIIPLLCRNQSQ